MQLMSWSVGRLGSRFNLCFEPHLKRVRHSGIGRFLDSPLDLAVGIVLPDGTERALPFTETTPTFYNAEQFERPNSVTYRAYSPEYRLRFEFNVHSVFYPQEEELCLMPAIYLEMRVNPANQVRWIAPEGKTPREVKLFFRINKPGAQMSVREHCDSRGACVKLSYENTLTPRLTESNLEPAIPDDGRTVHIDECIVSINKDARLDEQGRGLELTLPVTEVGSGTKWRLVWASYTKDPILTFEQDGRKAAGRLRYTSYWSSLEEVVDDAIADRDDRLAHSRNFEKAIEQAPLRAAQRHLLNQSFQQFLSNTFWCDLQDNDDPSRTTQWFSVWGGSSFYQSALDVEYNLSLLYLSIWPKLLAMQFEQWSQCRTEHDSSGGAFMHHDLGRGTRIGTQARGDGMPVEENCNFLLMLQAYTHWSGDVSLLNRHDELVRQLADYLVWTDRDNSGFPSVGTLNAVEDATSAQHEAPKQTYLAVKRLVALNAATDLLRIANRSDDAQKYENVVQETTPHIESQAWLGDHYAVCVDPVSGMGDDAVLDEPDNEPQFSGWDGYSIYTANGLLLPVMTGHPSLLLHNRLYQDLTNALRETLSPYGCSHTDAEPENVWISQNLWRDHLARYLGFSGPAYAQGYWDMQVMSNTGSQSLGFVDTYIGNNLCFHPRGITSMGYLLSYPRLVVDRLAPGGARISVNPDRNYSQRWPLLPLADWKAGKIPILVVERTPNGTRVLIENEMDPVIIHGESASTAEVIG